MVVNNNFLTEGIIQKYPRFEIHRRVFQDYAVLRTYNAQKFYKWTEWRKFKELPGGDKDFAVAVLNKLTKESENSKITIEYMLVNNYPNITNEVDYFNYITETVKLQKIHDR